MTKQYGLSLSDDVAASVDAWRFAMPVPASRSAALAALVNIGLTAAGAARVAASAADPVPPPLLARMDDPENKGSA